MNRTKKIILFVPIITISIIVILFLTSEWWCPSMWGSYSLGNNLYAMDWDGGVQIIVYNENPKGRTVYSGVYVIPNPNSNDSTFNVIIRDIKFNKEWVIVKAEQQQNEYCYFLIHKNFNIKGLDWQKDNCDSIIQSNITQYYNLSTFYEVLKQKHINLKFSSVPQNLSSCGGNK